jgi:hypothetical protein
MAMLARPHGAGGTGSGNTRWKEPLKLTSLRRMPSTPWKQAQFFEAVAN